MHRHQLSQALGIPVVVLVEGKGDSSSDLLRVVLCYGYAIDCIPLTLDGTALLYLAFSFWYWAYALDGL